MKKVPIQRESTSKNNEPVLPGYLPHPMPDYFPPYASGGGYVLSADLVPLVAFPPIEPVLMTNEDAYVTTLSTLHTENLLEDTDGLLRLPFVSLSNLGGRSNSSVSSLRSVR